MLLVLTACIDAIIESNMESRIDGSVTVMTGGPLFFRC